jgi:hypothetical protein
VLVGHPVLATASPSDVTALSTNSLNRVRSRGGPRQRSLSRARTSAEMRHCRGPPEATLRSHPSPGGSSRDTSRLTTPVPRWKAWISALERSAEAGWELVDAGDDGEDVGQHDWQRPDGHLREAQGRGPVVAGAGVARRARDILTATHRSPARPPTSPRQGGKEHPRPSIRPGVFRVWPERRSDAAKIWPCGRGDVPARFLLLDSVCWRSVVSRFLRSAALASPTMTGHPRRSRPSFDRLRRPSLDLQAPPSCPQRPPSRRPRRPSLRRLRLPVTRSTSQGSSKASLRS